MDVPNSNQCLLSLDTSIEIEHIFAKNRQNKEQSLSDARKLEQIGNKAILEKELISVLQIIGLLIKSSIIKALQMGEIKLRKAQRTLNC